MGNTYKTILKATSLTGGAQIGQIIAKLFSAKALAIILGPSGIGFIGLLQSTINVIITVSGAGLSFSSIRNIAEVSGDVKQVAEVKSAVRFWLLVTGLLGTVFTFFLAPFLSTITFGSPNNAFLFRWLSITVLLSQITKGQLAILQGLRKIKDMAYAKVSGAFIGLAITVPIYYFFKLDGVIAALIILSMANIARSWYFMKKQNIPVVPLNWQMLKTQGKSLFSLGMVGLFSGLGVVLAGFIIRALLRDFSDDTVSVGIYQAAWVIGVANLDLIFMAMSGDYYPRLTTLKDDWNATNIAIYEQRNIALWIGIPVLTGMCIFSNLVVQLLYSAEFLPAAGIISIITLGVFFKLLVWPIGFLLVVNLKNRAFLFFQILWQTLFLLGFYVLFDTYNLLAIGISFSLTYLLHLIYVWSTAKKFFPDLSTSKAAWKEILIGGIFIFLSLAVKLSMEGMRIYIAGGLILMASLLYSFLRLRPLYVR